MNWRKFLEGLAVSAVTGGLTAGTTYLADPSTLTGPALGRRVGLIGAVGAIGGILAWLRQSPLQSQNVSTPTSK